MQMSKVILGLDLGSNSIGWALLKEKDGKPNEIINIGSRIFTKAVEEKTPTPKNVKLRNARLSRRVTQRRARRKLRNLT
jgi:CRISPR-associated endonuclease Csn1